MKTQLYGVEIEMKNMDVSRGACVLSDFFNTRSINLGGMLSAHGARDSQGRVWKVVTDASVFNGCELVTPILEYSDIETLQALIRKFRTEGAKIDGTCGIHVHVNLKRVKTRTVFNLVNLFYKYEDLIFKSCKVKNRRIRYCSPTSESFIHRLNDYQPRTKDAFKTIWYDTQPDCMRPIEAHYHLSRYHALNLHSWFCDKGSVEFRLFNSTLHAGRVKAYIQFCLAVVAKAKTLHGYAAAEKLHFNDTAEELKVFREFLREDLNLKDDEFKTCRHHLLANFVPLS